MKKSTTIILIIIILVIISIGLLYRADRSQNPVTTPPTGTVSTTPPTTTTTPPAMPADFKSYTNSYDGFTVAYPSDIATVAVGNTTPTQDWSYSATSAEPGTLDVTFDIPNSFEPKTNFGDARFTVGSSATNAAITGCFAAGEGNPETQSNVTINGINFTKFNYSDAGAGQFYNVTDYRTLNAGKCYSVEYIIHSSNIGNYDPSQGVTAFDQPKVQNILEEMVQTFKFN